MISGRLAHSVALLVAIRVPGGLSPTRTAPHFCRDYFRIAGHSPGTRTVGVYLFGLVNERIGDFAASDNRSSLHWRFTLPTEAANTRDRLEH
jgi:hypothetical protein